MVEINPQLNEVQDSTADLFKYQLGLGVTKRVDEPNSSTTYVGTSYQDTPDTSKAEWQIKRVTTSGSETIIEWADGDEKFDNVWDNRTGLSYK